MTEFIISIIAGLLAIVLGWFLNGFFKKIIIPHYLHFIYKGKKIDDTWLCNYKENRSKTPSQTITIHQKGPKLSGKIQIHLWADGSKANRVLLFDGEINGNKVFLKYDNSDKPDVIFGSIIFKLSDDGTTLNGWAIGVEPSDSTVYAEKRIWKRRN